jgi:hypothetical protein
MLNEPGHRWSPRGLDVLGVGPDHDTKAGPTTAGLPADGTSRLQVEDAGLVAASSTGPAVDLESAEEPVRDARRQERQQAQRGDPVDEELDGAEVAHAPTSSIQPTVRHPTHSTTSACSSRRFTIRTGARQSEHTESCTNDCVSERSIGLTWRAMAQPSMA